MTRLISLFLLFNLFTVATAGNTTWTDDLAKAVKRNVSASGISQKELGLWIGYEEQGQLKEIYGLNSTNIFIPASLSKLVTGATSLSTIELDHSFKTQLLRKAKVTKGVLKGDLAIKGFGDPGFVSESMWVLVNKFVRSGITKIEGNLVVDDTFFDNIRYDEDREDNRVDRAYDAPVGALSFNWNSINVYIRPGDAVGAPLKVFADPASEYIKVVNRGTTVSGKTKSVRVSRVEDPSRKGDTIVVAGSLGVDQEEIVKYKSITEPDYWTGYHLKEFLGQRGVVVTGDIVRGKADGKWTVVAEHESESLAASVTAMMKFSNNYVAEMLTKNMAAYTKNVVGNMDDGLKIIREFLEKEVGINKNHYNFVNPSGLTRENKFRPYDLAQLLYHVRKDFTIYPEFLTSLPIAGVDGTLKDRMNGTEAENWVRAKTGMLNGVLGLAGYAGREGGQLLIFAFVFNGKHSRINAAARVFDALAESMVSE